MKGLVRCAEATLPGLKNPGASTKVTTTLAREAFFMCQIRPCSHMLTEAESWNTNVILWLDTDARVTVCSWNTSRSLGQWGVAWNTLAGSYHCMVVLIFFLSALVVTVLLPPECCIARMYNVLMIQL